jgi:molybdopterin-guanine dinucleotide biosynthesis protein A
VIYPLEALAPVCERLAVVCKAGTLLPELPPGVERWDEPDEPRHPLTGILHALETAGAPVLVCAADMPFVTADAARSLIEAAHAAAGPAIVATAGGRIQPTFGLYSPAAIEPLRAAPPDGALTAAVEGLEPRRVALPESMVRGVNTPDELAAAEAVLATGR